jgi:deoxyxylulose-5-phosphate synthase
VSLLDQIGQPADLRRLKPENLRRVVEEVRARHIDVVSE